MERLTYKGRTYGYTSRKTFKEVCARLAEYENTELPPDVCAEYKKFEDEVVGKGVTFKRIVELMNAEADGRLVILEKNDDPMSRDALALFLQNRADMAGELNEYDKMFMREASERLAEIALRGGSG